MFRIFKAINCFHTNIESEEDAPLADEEKNEYGIDELTTVTRLQRNASPVRPSQTELRKEHRARARDYPADASH